LTSVEDDAQAIPRGSKLMSPALASAVTRPNVVVFMTDDQTSESLRVMRSVQSELVKKGVRFTSSFVSFPLCCPSRATYLTGLYAHNHHVLGNDPPAGGYTALDPSATLPVWLQRAGYHTAHVGKYLNGYGLRDPLEIPPGWDEWYGAVDGRGTYRYYGFTLNQNGVLIDYRGPNAYRTDVEARKAVGIIERASGSGRPFFLSIGFLAPHAGEPVEPDDPPNPVLAGTPVPAARHKGRFAGEPLPLPRSFNEDDVSDKPANVRLLPPMDRDLQQAVTEKYRQRLESLLAVDEAVGSIVAALKRSGELRKTILVFTSDNGYFHGEHRIPTEKGLPYDPALRVPLIIRGPGIPRGKSVRQMVANIDLAPTIVAATGARASWPFDGRSLLPLMRHAKRNWDRDLLVEGGPLGFSGLRTRHFLYAEYANGERELYDLRRDPAQLQNIHGEPRYQAIQGELARRHATMVSCRGASCHKRPRASRPSRATDTAALRHAFPGLS
jgi:N-acetylglucosamine-6-sulfatase